MPDPDRSKKAEPGLDAGPPPPDLAGPDLAGPELAGLERVRKQRVKPRREPSLKQDFDAQIRRIRTLRRAVAGAGGAWAQAVPQDLCPSAQLVGVTRATLTVRVKGSGERYKLDRWLRTGGSDLLTEASGGVVRRVRVVLAQQRER